MSKKESRSEIAILENHQKNVDLYNKYLILATSVLVAVIFNTELTRNFLHTSCVLKLCVSSLLISLLLTVLELGMLILKDGIELGYIQNASIKKLYQCECINNIIEKFILCSYALFLIGIILLIFFVFII